jgi:hypothetical protein
VPGQWNGRARHVSDPDAWLEMASPGVNGPHRILAKINIEWV